jgi:hypothetical protein
MAITQEQLNRILGKQSVVDRVLSTNAIDQKLNAPENIVTGGILPIQKNKVTGQMALAMPEFIKSIQQAYTAPARAMRGEFDPNSIQGIQEANNIGLNLLGIGQTAPIVSKGATAGMQGGKTLSMFIGEKSPAWNKEKANLAIKLEKSGFAPEDIWKKTGTLRGVEGKLRQEISDVGSNITDNVYEGIVKNKRFEGKMGEALTHPELYKAYPDIADIGTGMYAWKTPEGSYESLSRTITAGGAGTTSQKSAALHEIMHDIQQKEGYAKGGTASSVSESGLTKENQFDWAKRAYENSIGKGSDGISDDKLLAELLGTPFKEKEFKSWESLPQREKLNYLEQGREMAYRRLAGEAEARLVQRRMDLTPEQRLEYFPYNQGKEVYGLDIPFNELIIKGLID